MSLSDEEKIRLLEKRITRLEEMLSRGARAQYLFCPSLNCWLPAQCDDEGRQVIDPSDLDTRYHKKGEDLDLESYYLIQQYFRLESSAAYGMIVRNADDSDYGHILCKNLKMSGLFTPLYAGTGFLTSAADKYIDFMGYSGGNILCAQLKNDSFAIQRAGDITGLAAKTLSFPNVVVSALLSPQKMYIPFTPQTDSGCLWFDAATQRIKVRLGVDTYYYDATGSE